MFQHFSTAHVIFLAEHMLETLKLVGLAMLCGCPGGLVIAALLRSKIALLRNLAEAFVYLVQGVPIVIVLFMSYYGLPRLGITLPPFLAMGVAFTLFTGAFLGEIWRSAIDSVAKGQWEAAHALGLGQMTTMLSIIGPQALRLATPPSIGFLVQLVKGTSVVSIIGITELTRAAQIVSNATFKPLPVFLVAAGFYFAINFPMTMMSRRLERRQVQSSSPTN